MRKIIIKANQTTCVCVTNIYVCIYVYLCTLPHLQASCAHPEKTTYRISCLEKKTAALLVRRARAGELLSLKPPRVLYTPPARLFLAGIISLSFSLARTFSSFFLCRHILMLASPFTDGNLPMFPKPRVIISMRSSLEKFHKKILVSNICLIYV